MFTKNNLQQSYNLLFPKHAIPNLLIIKQADCLPNTKRPQCLHNKTKLDQSTANKSGRKSNSSKYFLAFNGCNFPITFIYYVQILRCQPNIPFSSLPYTTALQALYIHHDRQGKCPLMPLIPEQLASFHMIPAIMIML